MVQGYDVNFRPCAETERNECAADAEADIKPASVFPVHVFPFGIKVLGRRPSEKHELHAMSMSGKSELDVGLWQNFAPPMGRVVAE